MNGKILQSELINKKNDPVTKVCMGFEYDLLVENEPGDKIELPFRFKRIGDKTWSVELVIGLQVYQVMFDTPKNGMDLTMVAAMGLRNLQYEIAQELEKKSILNFTIGDEIKNM